jgi:Rad3-related DNA helicase
MDSNTDCACPACSNAKMKVVLNLTVIARKEGGFLHLPLTADTEARVIQRGKIQDIAKGKLRKLDSEAFILHGLTAGEAGLPESVCADASEMAFLASGIHDCTALDDMLSKQQCEDAETWRVKPEFTGDDAYAIVEATKTLAALWTALEPLSEHLLKALGRIADAGGFPMALITQEAAQALTAETGFHAADLKAYLPVRAKVRTETAQEAARSLPSDDEVFKRLKEGAYRKLGYEYRPEQEQFARAVAESLAKEEHLLIEAGTGVGKSLGYLIPAVRHALKSGETVLVSTNTKILQDQLMLSDYPKLCELFEYKLPPPVVLKGRENYLCLEKLRLRALSSRSDLSDLFEGLGAAREGRKLTLAIMRLVLHIASETSGDFEHIQLPPGIGADVAQRMKKALSAAFRGCLRDQCPMHKQCYFYGQREAAEKSPLTVVNHALLFALANPAVDAGDQMASFVDKAPVWILDEAHNLEEVLLDQMGAAIVSGDIIEFINSLHRLAQSRALGTRMAMPSADVPANQVENYTRLKSLLTSLPGNAEAIYEDFKRLAQIAERAYTELREEGSGDHPRWDLTEPDQENIVELKEELTEAIGLLSGRLVNLSDGMSLLAEQTGGETESFFYLDDTRYQIQLRESVNTFVSLKEACKALLGEGETWVKWMEVQRGAKRGEHYWLIAACPIVVEERFTQLIDRHKSTLMVSGTLAVNGNFGYVKRCLGLFSMTGERLTERILSSPFNFKQNALVLIPSDMPEPDFRSKSAHKVYLEALAGLVQDAAVVFGGATLVLFNSYTDLQKVAELTDGLKDTGFSLLVQERGISRHHLANEFKQQDKAVLFGVRSFWEGFDIKGDNLQCVIISKFPFPNLHDPLTAGKCRYIDRHGGSSFADYMLPYAIMKFTQGFGRLIRSTDDYGCVLMLDGRVLTKRYGMDFLRNLPNPKVIKLPREDIASEMESFLRERRGGA